jgi:Ca-activated chloride channel family protein
MPSFDDTLNLALNGVNGGPGLLKNNARHKHIIIISDGDPTAPQQALMNACKSNRISVSTVTVFPHSPKTRPPVMEDMATFTGGKAYGPIEDNPNQLPQIFIKEATIVKRSLIHEPEAGIPIKVRDPGDDMVKGIDQWPVLRGMVLTSRKKDPKVEMPLATGAMNDPILAHWQSGLGKSAVWTSDATRVWGAGWVSSPDYNKLFAQMIRGVSRPPMSGDFDVRTTIEGTQGEITVTALDKDGEYANFLNVAGSVIGGAGMDTKPIRLVQTGPGTYKGTFATNGPGSYVAYLTWRGKGKEGQILTGAVMNSTPENRDLKSNEARLEQVRAATGGRMLEAFSPVGSDLFSRDGLRPSSSPLPVWDVLVPWLLALVILDVAVRRIAWDWNSTKKLAQSAAERVRAYTTLRRVEARPTLDALKRVRDEVAETKFRTDQGQAAGGTAAPPPVPGTATIGAPRPDPKAKFEAKKGVEGDITQVVGGATAKPGPPPPQKVEPKGGRSAGAGTGEHLGGLMAAKKRAQQQIKEKEQGEPRDRS